MTKQPSFVALDSPVRRQLFGVFSACVEYLADSQSDDEATARLIAQRSFPSGGSPLLVDQVADARGRLFFGGLQSMISYFVASAFDAPSLGRVGDLVDIVAEVLQARLGDSVRGWTISFETLSALRQCYWDARARKTARRIERNRTHRVIRINDIPFAEAIFPTLMSWHSDRFGYSIVIEDVPWSEVGASLINGRIDVAIYPSYIKAQMGSIETLFDRQSIYRSEPLLKYRDYPVIRNTHPRVGLSKLGVPHRSDFDPVLHHSAKNGCIHFRKSWRERSSISVPSDIVFCKSADEVVARVVNGELEFGLVGGLQARYAVSQFGQSIRPGKPGKVELCTNLNGPDDDGDCFFWVAVNRRDEAEMLVGAMVALWNELVFHGWQEVLASDGANEASDKPAIPSPQVQLVEMVNAHSHWSFVKDFDELRSLIVTHDRDLHLIESRAITLER